VKKYLKIITICLIAFLINSLSTWFPIEWSLTINALISSFVIFLLLRLGQTPLILSLSVIEFLILALTFGAGVVYLTDSRYLVDHYISGLNLLKIAVLISWIPNGLDFFTRSGRVYKGFRRTLWMVDYHNDKSTFLSSKASNQHNRIH